MSINASHIQVLLLFKSSMGFRNASLITIVLLIVIVQTSCMRVAKTILTSEYQTVICDFLTRSARSTLTYETQSES